MKHSSGLLTLALACGCFLPAVAEDQPAKPTHAAVTPAPRDANWMKRHESFNERVAKGNVDLIFIGDSITQGWEGAGREAWAKYYGQRNAVNLGIGGDRTQHVLWRLDNGNIKDIQPKLAVIMIGTNNSRDNSPEEIFDGNKAIVEKLRAALPETKILLLAIFPRGADTSDVLRQKTQKANELIAKLADDQHVWYLDIGPNFLDENGVLSREVMPDLLHLNPASYETWGKSIEPMVAKLLGEPGDSN